MFEENSEISTLLFDETNVLSEMHLKDKELLKWK